MSSKVNQSDPIFDAVTAPGTPFELAELDGMRRFVNASSDINEMIERARVHGDSTCVVEDGTRLSFTQLFERRDALAGILNIERGDRVAICMRNRVEWMVAFLAVIRCGGIAALLNSRGSANELCDAVSDVSPSMVLADSDRAALLREAGYTNRLIEAADFPAKGAAPLDVIPARRDDPAVILFTSGTTGHVKGAVLTHGNLITGIMGIQLSGTMVLYNTARDLDIPVSTILENLPQHAVMLAVPLFHISGLGAGFLAPLLAGSKIVIMRRWSARGAIDLIQSEKITMFSGVPTMMWDIIRASEHDPADLSSLRNIGIGGQAMPIGLLNELRVVCPSAVMGTGYGLTETSGGVAMSVGADFIRNRGSAGRVLSLVELQIRSPDGTALPSGEVGEITVRGPMVMQGYWQRPEETATVLSADGWLKSGDVGYVDPEGYVFIVDRAKDMVISAGENIYCAEIERIVNAMSQITECAAFGIPDERLGELLVARVVGSNIDANAIISEVAEKLARYKAPAHVRIDSVPLPRNDVGKIDKMRLRNEWILEEGVRP